MSVKLLDNKAFYGYRVRRTVDGNLFQEYFSLKASGKRLKASEKKQVHQQALHRDAELAKEQDRARQANKADRCFHANGSVRGISYLVKTEKSGSRTPIFQVGIASEKDGKIICTSYSINAHGKSEAWALAVATFAEHKRISKGSKLYKKLLAAMPKRAAAATPSATKKASKAAKAGAAKSKKAGKKAKVAAKKKTKATKQAAAGKAVSKKAAKKAVKKAVKKAANKSAKKAAKKTVKKAAKKTAKSSVKKTAKSPAKKTTKRSAKKSRAKKS